MLPNPPVTIVFEPDRCIEVYADGTIIITYNLTGE